MKIDLARLRMLHPRLTEQVASSFVHRGAIALQRRHVPGVQLTGTDDGAQITATVHWPAAAPSDADILDSHRITEDGAEAVALCLVRTLRDWTIKRRLQRGLGADWLLASHDGDVALEVSGTDDGSLEGRATAKLAQARSVLSGVAFSACVVRFREPCAILVTETAHDHR
jgi:hypothetical protein